MARTTTTIRGVLSLVVLASSGCGSLASFERALEDAGIARFAAPAAGGRSVQVRASLEPGQRAGRGAVVGDRWILTVGHVVEGRETVFVSTTSEGGWVEARVARRVAGNPEDLVLLEMTVDEGAFGLLLGFDGFAKDSVLHPSASGVPAEVLTPRGAIAWRPGVLVPGDSGSPVLDDSGRLVGIVSGRRGDVGVFVALATEALPGEPVTLLAARF